MLEPRTGVRGGTKGEPADPRKKWPLNGSISMCSVLESNQIICDIDPNAVENHTTTTVLRSFFQDHPGEPVPEENFWTLLCKGRLTEADTQTIWLGATPSRLNAVE